jgi:hypothetical protein
VPGIAQAFASHDIKTAPVIANPGASQTWPEQNRRVTTREQVTGYPQDNLAINNALRALKKSSLTFWMTIAS